MEYWQLVLTQKGEDKLLELLNDEQLLSIKDGALGTSRSYPRGFIKLADDISKHLAGLSEEETQ